jgi:hypothetical protein
MSKRKSDNITQQQKANPFEYKIQGIDIFSYQNEELQTGWEEDKLKFLEECKKLFPLSTFTGDDCTKKLKEDVELEDIIECLNELEGSSNYPLIEKKELSNVYLYFGESPTDNLYYDMLLETKSNVEVNNLKEKILQDGNVDEIFRLEKLEFAKNNFENICSQIMSANINNIRIDFFGLNSTRKNQILSSVSKSNNIHNLILYGFSIKDKIDYEKIFQRNKKNNRKYDVLVISDLIMQEYFDIDDESFWIYILNNVKYLYLNAIFWSDNIKDCLLKIIKKQEKHASKFYLRQICIYSSKILIQF